MRTRRHASKEATATTTIRVRTPGFDQANHKVVIWWNTPCALHSMSLIGYEGVSLQLSMLLKSGICNDPKIKG